MGLTEKLGAGGVIGLGCGLVAGAVGGCWGGYELGSALNNYLNISNTVGRGALDLVVIGVVFNPALAAGAVVGAVAGATAGGIARGIAYCCRAGDNKLVKKDDKTCHGLIKYDEWDDA